MYDVSESFKAAYLARLRRSREARRVECERTRKGTIAEELLKWWQDVPEDQRQTFYTMTFFKVLVERIYGRRRSAGEIGLALHVIGFWRKRLYGIGPSCRVWVPSGM